MSRSWRKAIHNTGHKLRGKGRVHKKLRRAVRMELLKSEPELTLLDADIVYFDDGKYWDTRFDFEFEGNCPEQRLKYSRK